LTNITVVATWFRKKKGFAIGMVASGASIAGLIYPLMIKTLIQKVGFNNAQRYTAILTAVTCLLAILIARPNPAHPARKPETWAKVSVWVDTGAFRNNSFAWLCAAIAFLFFGFYAVFFNLEEWAASTGIGYKDDPNGGGPLVVAGTHPDAMRAFWLLSIMNATSTLGRLSSAYLCDHFGAMNVHCFVTTIASLLVLILWTLADTVKAAIGFVVVFGVFSGAVIGLPPASVAHILGPDPAAQAKLGQWTGMMYSCAAVFALTGPVIAGHLITEFANDFRTVQLWSGACMFISACCMAMAIYCKHRQMTREWFSDKRRRLSSVTSGTMLSKSRSRGGASQREEV
jgi:MCP family monocarboxylic acid transporter-like MFS transporter 10